MPHESSRPPATDRAASTPDRTHHLCPWWLGYALASPLRRLVESPERLLAPHVRSGMTVVEPGCGMGYFSLPLARMVGPNGRVMCVDLQPKMIGGLERRARRAGLLDRIHAFACTAEDLSLGQWRESADFAVALHMIHEVPDPLDFSRSSMPFFDRVVPCSSPSPRATSPPTTSNAR